MFLKKTYLRCLQGGAAYLLLSLLFFAAEIKAQDKDSLTLVKGKIILKEAVTGFTDVLVINMTKGTGVYGNLDGTFEIKVHKNDLIKISCRGYKTASISVKDSVYKAEYNITVTMDVLEIVREDAIIIRPQPTIEKLKKSQSEIGTYKYEPLVSTPLEMIFHPITAIYQLFSKKEAEKRKYAMFVSQKQLDDYITDVTRYLMKSGLIDLTEEELPRFVARCPISEDFAKEASLYEVSTVINSCYKEYARRYKVERY